MLLGGAAAFTLLALTAHGPLGAVRLVGRRLHAAADILVALALAAAPLLPALRPGALGIAAVEIVALLWLRVVTLTRYASAPRPDADAPEAGTGGRRRARRRLPSPAKTLPPASTRGRARSDDTKVTGTPKELMGASPADAARAGDMARTLGLFAGRAARRLPQGSGELADQARQAGRRAARARQAIRGRTRL